MGFWCPVMQYTTVIQKVFVKKISNHFLINSTTGKVTTFWLTFIDFCINFSFQCVEAV